MQSRRAAFEQAAAKVGDDLEAEGADRRRVVTIALELDAHPARDLGAAGLREARELREITDRHDAGDDRHADAGLARLVDEAEEGVAVVEVLRDRGIGTGIDLALEGDQLVARDARLRMVFGVAGHLDVEPVAGALADERDQFVGIAELTRGGDTRRHVSAQRHDVADAIAAVALELLADFLACRGDTRKVRRGVVSGLANLQHRLERAFARRAAGTEGAREKARLELSQLLPSRAQLFLALRGLRREELEAESLSVH